MTKAPLYWVKEIQNALIDAKLIPLSGFAPAFPWEALSEKIATLLHCPELKIVARKTQFLQPSELNSGLGASAIPIALELTPLSGQAFWVMGKEDIAKLTTLALSPSNGSKGFSSPKLQEGFYYYLATEAASTLDELGAFNDLSLKIGKPGALPQEESLCIDVEIQHPKHTFWGRLICPVSMHEAFRTHFSTHAAPSLDSALAKQLDVTVRLELGQTHLSLSEWKKVKVGDCILLDRCTYDPKTKKGTAQLMLEQTPILRAKIKDNSLKIVDYAFYREEKNQMNPHPPHEEENPEEHNEPEAFTSDELETEIPTDDSHLWSSDNEETTSMISTKEIPLTLSVEVARMRISLEKLLQLSAGNVLELPVKPEQGVDIVVGGKKIAKAELVKLGDMLGVKILQIGE